MSIFAIADLHLSTGAGIDKSMEVFGKRWRGYTEKIRRNWEASVGADDTVVIPGDISWAMRLEDALSDLEFLNGSPDASSSAKEITISGGRPRAK